MGQGTFVFGGAGLDPEVVNLGSGITADDLLRFGLIPELVGRLPVVVPLQGGLGLLLALLVASPARAQQARPAAIQPCSANEIAPPPGVAPNLPPANSGPIYRCAQLMFHPAGDRVTETQPMVDSATYAFYLRTTPSQRSQNRWVTYDESAIQSDFWNLWRTNFLEDLWIERFDEPYENGVVGVHVVFHMEERARVKIVDYVPARHTLFEVQKSTPFELGLGWCVALDKGRFVGRAALRAEAARGPRWATVGLEARWESLEQAFAEFGLPPQLPTRSWNEPVPVYAGRRQVGKATSGAWSPLLKKYLALARVTPAHATPGTTLHLEVTVEGHRRNAAATVVPLPFFDPPRKRT